MVYKKAEIKVVDDEFATVTHDSGVSKIRWVLLPNDVRKDLGMDEETVKAKEEKGRAEKEQKQKKEIDSAQAFAKGVKEARQKLSADLDFNDLVFAVQKSCAHGKQFAHLPEFEWLSSPLRVILAFLGKPDLEYHDELTWRNKIKNPVTDKLEDLSLSLNKYSKIKLETPSGKVWFFEFIVPKTNNNQTTK